MPSFHVERSVTIDTDKENLKAILSDFRQIRNWSPWLIIEPEATVEYSGTQGEVGASQAWDGKMVGSGSMELTEIHANSLIYALQFQKPFKSKAKVTFELSEEDGATTVSWNMYGKLPWFLFFMTSMMKTYIGMDYERGLTMLKEYAETGTVSSKLELMGVGELEDIYYMGLEKSCAIKAIGEVMGKDFDTLGQYVEEHQFPKNTQVFTIYKKFDMMKGNTAFISCISIAPEYEVPAPFIKGKLEGGKALNVRHTGKYDHLGNAWSLAMNYVRHNKMRIRKKPFGYEFYLNSPHEVSAEELVTDVIIPLK